MICGIRKRSLNSRQMSGRKPVAADEAQAVRALLRMRRRVDKVAAQLADILHERAVPARDVVPELAGGKLLAQHHRAAPDEHGAGRQQAAGGVVHRQAVVHAVVRARVHDARKGVAREHDAVVVHVGGLGQAGGAGRVDEQRAILDRELAPLVAGQRVARKTLDLAVDARAKLGARRRRAATRSALTVRCGLRGLERREQLRRHDDVLGRDDVDAVRERVTGQVGVEQRDHAADPR